MAKKRPVRNPSEEKAADKEAENIEKLDVACLWCSAVLRNETLSTFTWWPNYCNHPYQ